ncbi:MAG: hypothetical protein EHM37_18490 [Deltaproteobacteria bacterium]|nr:MAG: hypothetical protein EHM37_18490 [Deltaproteobacteria bacterium]
MPVVIEKHPALNLTIFKATGSVPFSEQRQVLTSFYEGSPTSNVIWDFTRATDVTISNSELRAIIQYTKEHAARRQAGRTALVVNTKLQYGLARMTSTFAEIEQTPWPIMVFEQLDEALTWIAERDPTGTE